MNIKVLMTLLAVFVSSWILNAQITTVSGLADIKFDKNAAGRDAWQKISVVAIIHPQLTLHEQTAGLLSRLQTDFSEKNVEVFAVMPSSLADAQSYAQSRKQYNFTLCAEPDTRQIKQLLGENFQAVSIFNYSGKMLWAGESIDLPMMIKLITEGKYNERDEIRISALVSRMQAALRSGDLQMIGQSADQVLDVRPEQLSAVNAKLYSLEKLHQYAQLEQFLRDRIKRFPQDPGYYIMLIEASFRIVELNHIAPELALSYFEKFPQDLENINSIAWSLMHALPFDSKALDAATRAGNILLNHPDGQKSRFLATGALIAYRHCQLPQALELTQKALKLAESRQEKAFLINMLNYYKHISK